MRKNLFETRNQAGVKKLDEKSLGMLMGGTDPGDGGLPEGEPPPAP